MGAAEFKREIYLNNSGMNILLDIWDVSGQDKFRSMTTMYFRDADACILVYDVTDRSSFEMISNVWLKDLQDRAPENILTAIVGNKCDLLPKIRDDDPADTYYGSNFVTEKEGQDLATQCGAVIHRLVSAKKNQGLNEMFQKLGDQLVLQPSNVSATHSPFVNEPLDITEHEEKGKQETLESRIKYTQERKTQCNRRSPS